MSEKQIPDGWRQCKLEDLVALDQEKLSEATDADYSFYYIDISSVADGKLQLPATKIAFRGSPSRARKVVHRKDVLMATVRPNLKAFAYFDHTDDDCIASTGFAVLTAKPSVDPRFVLNAILSDDVSAQIESHVVGSNYPAINSSDVRRLKILAPTRFQEQEKIARILTTVDNLIEKTEALIAKYRAIKQGMMHDLFTRGVDAHGHLRPPQTEAPDLYKQSELGWIPKEWDTGTIDDFCEIHNHLRFPISSEQREQMQGDYPYYGPTGIFDWLDHHRVDGEYALIGEDGDHFLKYSIQPMTILASGRFNVNNHAHLLKGKNGCTTEWVHTYYCHRDIKNHLTHQGAGRLKLNKAALRAMPLVVPEPSEQQQICQRFRSLNLRVSTEQVQLGKLKKLKTGLMQDLLTGKVRVKVDDTEEVKADV